MKIRRKVSTTTFGILKYISLLTTPLKRKYRRSAIKNGINEFYDSISGKPLGVPDYCMSSTIATMMLDGLTDKYELSLKKPTL